jgi:hypothetical protein
MIHGIMFELDNILDDLDFVFWSKLGPFRSCVWDHYRRKQCNIHSPTVNFYLSKFLFTGEKEL